jgi:MFS family permease
MKFPLGDKKRPASHYPSVPGDSTNIKKDCKHQEKITSFAWKVLFILSSIATLVMYAETMISIAIPEIIKEFSISYNTSSWILTIYLIVGGIMTPISGKLSDIYGRKRILTMIVAAYVIGVTIGGFSGDIYIILVARVFQGIGMSFFPIAYSILKDIFPSGKMAIGQGIVTSMFASGSVLGIILGGPIIQYYGWKMTYFSLIPIAVGLLIVVRRLTAGIEKQQKGQKQEPEVITRKSEPPVLSRQQPFRLLNLNLKTLSARITNFSISVDLKGALLLAASITSLLLLLTSFESNSDNLSERVESISILILYLAVGIVSLLLFVFVETRDSNHSPIVDLHLLTRKPVLVSNLLALIVGFWTFIIFYTIPILAKNPAPIGLGVNSVDTSFLLLPFALVLLIFGPTSGVIISRIGSTKPILIGSFFASVGFSGLLFFHHTQLQYSIDLVILSIGISLTNVGAQNVVMQLTPRQSSGMSLAMASLLKLIGSSIGPAVAATYLQRFQYMSLVNGMKNGFPSAQAYDLIFASSIIVSGLSVVLALVISRHNTQSTLSIQ